MSAGTTATVNFNVEFQTGFGEDVILVGSVPELGQWNTKQGVRMHTSEVDFPFWTSPPISLSLPRDEPVLYKYVITTADGRVEWESGPDRKISRTIFPDIMDEDVSIEDFASRHHAPTMERRPSQIKLNSSSYAACRSRLVATVFAFLMVAAMMHAASLLLRNHHSGTTKEPLVLRPSSAKISQPQFFDDGYSWETANVAGRRLSTDKGEKQQVQTTMTELSTSITSLGRSLFEAMQLASREFMILSFTFKMNVIEFVQKKGFLVLAIFVAGATARASFTEKQQRRSSW